MLEELKRFLVFVRPAFSRRATYCWFVVVFWYQLEHRVQGHILFSFLAYALRKTLQIWMERSGLGRGVRTVIEEFARLKANDVIIRTSTGREIRLCCITQPDPAQRALLDRMGLMIPERLGRPSWIRKPKNSNGM